MTTISERAQQLRRARTPFVHATVVRAAPPTSARAGDQAILLADGSIEGFVGGQCAQNSVRKAALGALQVGESVLLRVLPDGDVHFPEAPGACPPDAQGNDPTDTDAWFAAYAPAVHRHGRRPRVAVCVMLVGAGAGGASAAPAARGILEAGLGAT